MIEYLEIGILYIQNGLEVVRGLLTKVTSFLPWEAQSSLLILFLVLSLWVGYFITSRFVTRPLQLSYLPYYLIISISIFLNLMYL